MTIELTADELAIVDEISKLGADLWDKSQKIEGLNTDPMMFSIMLFKRLWSNHRGYITLWNSGLYLEGDILLRSGLEAAICIAANFKLRGEFVWMMLQDAAFTVQGQIKMHRDNGDAEMVRDGEAHLRMLQGRLPEGVKAAKLAWADLAKQGGVPQLYGFHRQLSGISAHVTGLSVLRGVVGGEKAEKLQDELQALTKKMHLMMMVGATLQAAMKHGAMIDDLASVEWAYALVMRMDALSMDWPGVEKANP